MWLIKAEGKRQQAKTGGKIMKERENRGGESMKVRENRGGE